MAQVDTFSTAGMEPRRKLAFWNAIACESLTPLVADPVNIQTFFGSLRRGRVGELTVAEVFSEAQCVRHSSTEVSAAQKAKFFLHLQLEGRGLLRCNDHEAALKAGDFVLSSSASPTELRFDGPNRMLVLGIPGTVLCRHLVAPETIPATAMSGAAGLNGLLSRFMRDFWREYQGPLDDAAAARAAGVLLDLVGSAYDVSGRVPAERAPLATAHFVNIVRYIEAHLSDPELTPTRIANACRITSRYLHHLFSKQDETVSEYMLRRRLEDCARALSAPAQDNRTLTSIAFDHGFSSSSHFGRAFRARFGMTPRDYRQEARGQTP